ncbi:microsomal epoxide hydrolase [Sphaerisporangium krabiense]|uniref:Microsomal epoxide hydrolase n=1 Tax=Sphaerisporangium krabiense TaxID=763782 RepID=A0A7W8Z245_9ACTN|nr:epoxide hydrolase family protein [Sphaerisporangium krabiense]MBB5626024.1 microsomal epoxide hydrolase [Sphaerisporangium krabiense]GII64829.1 microsomal epoxide hydrolase [Sphaerisporangium krabiense]
MVSDGLVRPFRVDIPQADLDDLADRLARTRWARQPAGAGWDDGVPVDYLKDLVEYWRTSYDWRKAEAELNSHPQFTTEISGATVHFLHVRSPEPDALPLVVTHGWPGSVAEFLDVIGPLTDPAAHGGDPADAFHVVIPSIPGFGLSGPARDTGWGVARVASAWAALMKRLGYHRYGAQGGDFGSLISRKLGVHAPDDVVGVHVNFLLTFPSGDPKEMAALTPAEMERVERLHVFNTELSGYAQVQTHRPHTLGHALADSPAGQLAWIVEKFKEWSRPAALPEDAVRRDRILTNVMLYWLTNTAASSARLYKDSAATFGLPETLTVPFGVAVFPGDVAPPIRRFAVRTNPNITSWTEFDTGGHFAALEVPDLFTEDVRRFFRPLRRPAR